MTRHKLLISVILLVFTLANAGVVAAALPGPIPPPVRTLDLRVEKSMLPIYPPPMIFTATLSPVPTTDITPQLMVEFYLSAPSLCKLDQLGASGGCISKLVYLGSAPVKDNGEAVFTKQLYPGTYTAVALIRINGGVISSNQVVFTVPGDPT